MKLLLIIPFLLVLLASQCQQGGKKSESEINETKNTNDTFQQKRVYDKIRCLNFELSYSLYLPGNQKGQELPLLLFFDPAAKGKKPVALYQQLAENYGYMLVGLNDSKNGMSWEQVQTIALTVLEDVFKRFSINEKRIYVCGFSGGARYALALALTDNRISGVISCGAAMPAINLPTGRPLSWCGIAGLQDFNYLEMRNFDHSLNATPLSHVLIEFDGEHAWPPVNVLEEALLFLESEAMKKALLPVNQNMLNKIRKHGTDSVFDFSKYPTLMERTLNRKIKMLEKLTNTDSLNKIIMTFCMQNNCQTDRLSEQQILIQENNQQKKYLEAFPIQDLAWWKTETAKLWIKTKSSNFYESRANIRVLNYISLACFMQCNQAFQQNIEIFRHFLTIYELADPDNPDMFYFKALLFMQDKAYDKAVESLKSAVNYGFRDKEKLLKEMSFNPLHSRSDWNELLRVIED